MESTARPPFARPGADDPYLARARRARPHLRRRHRDRTSSCRTCTPTTSAAPPSKGATRCSSLHRPDAVERLHRSFLDVGVDVIETNTFGAFSVVLAEYGIAERAHELADGVGVARATRRRRVRDARLAALRRGLDGPGHQVPHAGPDHLRRPVGELRGDGLRRCSKAASTCSWSRRSTTCSRARPPSRRATGPWSRHGRVVPIQAQVTIELTGRMLPGTEIGAAITALAPTGRGRPRTQLRDRTGRDVRAAAPAQRVRADAAVVPAQRRPAQRGRRQDALRPDARTPSPSTWRSS